MAERLKKLKDNLRNRIAAAIHSHRNLYGSLSASHLWAAMSTGKPEVYLPMVVIYGILAIIG